MPVELKRGVEIPHQASPATPATGKSLLYPKSDGLWYSKDSTGVETLVGPSSGGGGSAVVPVQTAEPSSPSTGQIFYDTDEPDPLPSDVPMISVTVAQDQNVAALTGLQTLDSYAMQAGDSILLAGQTDATQNGVWVVASGAWSRDPRANTTAKLTGLVVRVLKGGFWSGNGLWRTNFKSSSVIGTNAMTWYNIPDGRLAVLTQNNVWTIGQYFGASSSTDIPARFNGASGQTADLAQWRDNLANVLAAVDSGGRFLEGGRRVASLTSRLTTAATSTSTTYASTGLSVTVSTGKVYQFKVRGQYRSAAATTGIGFRIGGTATATGIRYETFIYGLTATTFTFQSQSAMSAAAAASTGVAALNTDYPFTIEGLIRVNAGGTFTLDFITEVAASTVTVQPDCLLSLQEVA